MTEQEYIDATNLARLRVISDILRTCVFLDEASKDAEATAARALRTLEARLDRTVAMRVQQ